MATGSTSDFFARLWRLIPSGWINNASSPIATAILGGISDSLAGVYSLLSYAIGQMRIATASSFWLDLIAWDFLGPTLVRSAGQNDASFQTVIRQQIVQPRVTRAGMTGVITNLTGIAPTIIEPWNTGDCGAWDVAAAMGWDLAGLWGEAPSTLPGQVFMIVSRSGWQGVPNISGWDCDFGGWDKGSQLEWTDYTIYGGTLTDAQIYAAIAGTVAEGVTAWVRLIA